MSTESKGGSSFSTMGLPEGLRQTAGRFYDLPLASQAAREALIDDYADDIESVHAFDVDVEVAVIGSRGIGRIARWDVVETLRGEVSRTGNHRIYGVVDRDDLGAGVLVAAVVGSGVGVGDRATADTSD